MTLLKEEMPQWKPGHLDRKIYKGNYGNFKKTIVEGGNPLYNYKYKY